VALAAPGADLRPAAIVQIVVNPDIAAVQVYPPATPVCDPNPPGSSSPGTPVGGTLPRTGGDVGGMLAAAAGLIVIGALSRRRARRLSPRS
jgi:hypothetical protein